MDYIQTMRRLIGNELLMTVGCGIILEKDGQILLQHRKDHDVWGIPGGVMEPGETFEETARRETLEETGLTVGAMQLFGLYSGSEGFANYPNGDQVFSVQLVFHSTDYSGDMMQETLESHEHRFFPKDALPKLNFHQQRFIHDWAEGASVPVIR